MRLIVLLKLIYCATGPEQKAQLGFIPPPQKRRHQWVRALAYRTQARDGHHSAASGRFTPVAEHKAHLHCGTGRYIYYCTTFWCTSADSGRPPQVGLINPPPRVCKRCRAVGAQILLLSASMR